MSHHHVQSPALSQPLYLADLRRMVARPHERTDFTAFGYQPEGSRAPYVPPAGSSPMYSDLVAELRAEPPAPAPVFVAETTKEPAFVAGQLAFAL